MTTESQESTEQINTRLKRAISRTNNQFALFFALVNFPQAIQNISQKLIDKISRPVIELTINLDDLENTSLDHWLKTALENSPEDAVVFLYNFSELLPPEEKQLRKNLQQINWRRSALSKIHRPLIIWLPHYAMDALAEFAPDFYDWYSNIYDYSTDSQTLEKVETQFQTEFSGNVGAQLRMNQKEKTAWIQTINSLLEDNKTKNSYRARLLLRLGLLYQSLAEKDKAHQLYTQALDIYKKNGDRSGEGTTLNNISQIYAARGDYETALVYLKKSLAIQQEIGNRSGEGTTLNNISQIFKAHGDYETALEYLKKSLAIHQEIGDKSGEGATLNNISQIYAARDDYETALEYLKKSLAIRQEIGDRSGEGTTLNNISQIVKARGDYETALEYLKKSLAIQQEIGNRSGEGTTLNNMATIAHARGDYETALEYLKKSLTIQQEIGDTAGLCTTLFNMGHIYWQNEESIKAMKAWGTVYGIAKTINLAQTLDALKNLADKLGLKGGLAAWEKLIP